MEHSGLRKNLSVSDQLDDAILVVLDQSERNIDNIQRELYILRVERADLRVSFSSKLFRKMKSRSP